MTDIRKNDIFEKQHWIQREESDTKNLPDYQLLDISRNKSKYELKVDNNLLRKHPDSMHESEKKRVETEVKEWNKCTFYLGHPIAEEDLYWKPSEPYDANDYVFHKDNEFSYLYYTKEGVTQDSINMFKNKISIVDPMTPDQEQLMFQNQNWIGVYPTTGCTGKKFPRIYNAGTKTK